MSEHVKETSDSGFENEVLKSDQPVLVDFWAAWCAPCRMLAPTVEAVAEKYAGNARVMPQDQFRVFLSTVTSEFGRRPGEPASKRASAGST